MGCFCVSLRSYHLSKGGEAHVQVHYGRFGGEPVLDEETGLPMTQTVEQPCQRLEATWVAGLTVVLR